MTGLPMHLVTVSPGMKSGTRERIFDGVSGGIELCVMPHVALADFTGEPLHISAELFA